ncbi:alcohol dehydrogenase catalytic domain-containing protein [Streptomyces sp. V4I2]|uniref:alcohol dehydrogenase catalytic domain-containing protein n=1 Tax=Streptomyces sp. V4I2 TaxID=3042280 RepID=UPI0027D84616|nr:alcohol dehydrogenase catalytic domain-containing protein [Streptomyces sp. V4I2]
MRWNRKPRTGTDDVYTDLHFVRGTMPGLQESRILGHEAVGLVEERGSGVRTFGPGDRVVVTSTMPCGTCTRCRIPAPFSRRPLRRRGDKARPPDRARRPEDTQHIPSWRKAGIRSCDSTTVATPARNSPCG